MKMMERWKVCGVRCGMSGIRAHISEISKRRSRAFSLTEILIAMIIVAIVGGAAAAALWLFVNSFSQMDDYTSAEFQLNHAVQRLSREFSMIGLGMPNNSGGDGSFAWSFRGEALAANRPVTSNFGGDPSEPGEWGGPVTIAAADSENTNLVAAPLLAGRGFIGPKLFYSWGVPTGVIVTVTGVNMNTNPPPVAHNSTLWLQPRTPDAETNLANVMWDGRNVGLQTLQPPAAGGAPRNKRSWLLLPTLGIPLLANGFELVNPPGAAPPVNVLVATTAPLPTNPRPAGAPELRSLPVMPLDEVHLMQVGRLYRSQHPDPSPNELRRVILDVPDDNLPSEVLARNIVGLQFVFDPDSRLLTMFIAARGNERNPVGVRSGTQPSAWPNWLPDIAAEYTNFRIVVKNISWRIRN